MDKLVELQYLMNAATPNNKVNDNADGIFGKSAITTLENQMSQENSISWANLNVL